MPLIESIPQATVRPSRAAMRPCRLLATWRHVGGAVTAALPTVVRAVSEMGLALIVRQPCAARMIFITLHDAEGKPAGTHLLWNKRCSLLKAGRYQLHGLFVQKLSSEELERVLSPGSMGTAVRFGSSRRR
jgi:hypothetical protein